MKLSDVKPGDLVIVEIPQNRQEPLEVADYTAWVIDPAVYPAFNEGDRMVRVEPAGRGITERLIPPSWIVGLMRWDRKATRGRRPYKIDRMISEWDPEEALAGVGGVTKVVKRK